MISESANLLSRRKFLAMLPSLPSLLFFPSGNVQPNRPKFDIGDYVEFRFYREEAGIDGWERGTIIGICRGSLDCFSSDHWSYRFVLEESFPHHQGSIGAIGECYEFELFPASRPLGVEL